MPENIVEKRKGADNQRVVCAFSAGGGIGFGGGLAAGGMKGAINHLCPPLRLSPRITFKKLAPNL